MPVKSYLVFPHKGKKEQLTQSLAKLQWCDVLPAENKDVLVLVTETNSEQEEESCLDNIKSIPELDHFTLVSGFDEKMTKN